MKRFAVLAILSSWCVLLACSDTDGPGGQAAAQTVTIYSGRSESLIGPILDRFQEASGIQIQVRYGSTSEMAATLLEEGERTPADLFVSQDAAALGALSSAGMLRRLPSGILERVEERFRALSGDWVGLSGRARVVVYNTDELSPEDLPQSLAEVTDPRFKGRFGLAPANGSFQAHLAVLRALEGDDRLAEWLDGVVANEPQSYPNNRTIVEAVLNGEIDWGLVNHYYLWRAKSENPEVPGANFFMPGGDASGFINVAGAGVLSDNQAALEVLRFLLSTEAQSYFAQETYEYPLIAGVDASVDLMPLDDMPTPAINYAEVSSSHAPALEAISASGLLP